MSYDDDIRLTAYTGSMSHADVGPPEHEDAEKLVETPRAV